MADINPFLHRLMKDKKEDVVHSSAYGGAQNRRGIGSASTESFATRRAIDADRSLVRKYDDSKVVNEVGDGVSKAKQFDPAVEAAKAATIKEQFYLNKNADKTSSFAKASEKSSPRPNDIQNSIRGNIRPNFKNPSV